MPNLRLICLLALKMTLNQLDFLRDRVGEHDPLYPLNKQHEIAEREKVFCNFTLLRSKTLTTLPEQGWMDFLDRRWRQYSEFCGFSFGANDATWAAFWKPQVIRATVEFHASLVPYCALVVITVKQKLRDLAERSVKADKVCGSVSCGSVTWLVLSVRFLGQCFVLALITHGHARMVGGRERQCCSPCKGEGVDCGTGGLRGSAGKSERTLRRAW